MNRTSIDWADMSWNPVTGCRHDCPYCYAAKTAKRFGGYDGALAEDVWGRIHVLDSPAQRIQKNGKTATAPFPFFFEPTLHRYRLGEPIHVEMPRSIFVCSMADLFGRWVPTDWIVEVFDACLAAPQHNYIFLTKNPNRYIELDKMMLLPRIMTNSMLRLKLTTRLVNIKRNRFTSML